MELFFNYSKDNDYLKIENIRKEGWESFYKSLFDLFIIKKKDFDKKINVKAFLKNFSVIPSNDLNSQFQTIGNYNVINSHPIIKIDEDRYFDKEYSAKAGNNRGKVGEEITYDLLSSVFGLNNTLKSIKITTKKGKGDTDIDILCILGSKALCVQVKSKKLTELARKGEDNALKNDFKEAVQDAYEQGLICRQKLLEKKAKFFDVEGSEIKLSENIDEVYIMGITTENYPSLAHQSHIMLSKKEDDPFPIILTVFDLELLVYYLHDPYDFLYYIKQRISLMEYFIAEEEMVFLGYHLDQKLWKSPKVDMMTIESDFGNLIDRNYYPIKAGLKVSDKGDALKKIWKNENFNKLCNELKLFNKPKITDILFYLFDLSGKARENLVNLIISIKRKTLKDSKSHNFSMPPDYHYFPRVGISYVSLNSNNDIELKNKLMTLCQVRKYKSKGDVWIGFGSLKDSTKMIDHKRIF